MTCKRRLRVYRVKIMSSETQSRQKCASRASARVCPGGRLPGSSQLLTTLRNQLKYTQKLMHAPSTDPGRPASDRRHDPHASIARGGLGADTRPQYLRAAHPLSLTCPLTASSPVCATPAPAQCWKLMCALFQANSAPTPRRTQLGDIHWRALRAWCEGLHPMHACRLRFVGRPAAVGGGPGACGSTSSGCRRRGSPCR